MLKVSNITKSYGKGDSACRVLKGISAEISDGEFVVITGPSGSGKSPFMNVVSGLERTRQRRS